MATTRERREAQAERLRGWAAQREQSATAVLAAGNGYRGDVAFATQPGHIPERARLIARTDAAVASLEKAASMNARANSIEAQAAVAIYSDDPDAIDRLRERLAGLEAQRDAMKAANAEFRKAHGPELKAMSSYDRSRALPHPSFELTNLGGQIKRNRDRLTQLEGAALS